MGVQIPPSALRQTGVLKVREIKPRLIFTDRKQRSGSGSARSLVIILLTFCIGVYVGIKLGGMDLDIGVQEKPREEHTAVLGDGGPEKTEVEENPIEEERASSQEGSSSGLPQSVGDTNSGGLVSVGIEESEVYENGRQEFADREGEVSKDEKEMFTIQTGAFKEIERANKAASELSVKGYEPYVIPYINSLGSHWYLVRIGRFKTRQEANEYALSFESAEGMEAIVEIVE